VVTASAVDIEDTARRSPINRAGASEYPAE
jgi:hypothetical protein